MRTIRVPTTTTEVAQHSGINAAVAIMLGGYLAVCLYQGNLSALATAAKQDFLGQSGQRGFWQWAAALLIIGALARNPKTNFLFGPLLIFVLVAMLIEQASSNQQAWSNLTTGVKSFFTGTTPTITNPPATTATVPSSAATATTNTSGILPQPSNSAASSTSLGTLGSLFGNGGNSSSSILGGLLGGSGSGSAIDSGTWDVAAAAGG